MLNICNKTFFLFFHFSTLLPVKLILVLYCDFAKREYLQDLVCFTTRVPDTSNTSVTRVQFEEHKFYTSAKRATQAQHKRDTSETRTTQLRHECNMGVHKKSFDFVNGKLHIPGFLS